MELSFHFQPSISVVRLAGLIHPTVVKGGLGSGNWQPKHKQHILINMLADWHTLMATRFLLISMEFINLMAAKLHKSKFQIHTFVIGQQMEVVMKVQKYLWPLWIICDSLKLILVTSDSATIMAENYRLFSKELIPAFKSFAHVRS